MRMEELIPLINKLQDVFSHLGHSKVPIDLPQIVVVGSQSAGKSSVLESIVGKEFLPRGDGLCTRRPLILQLYHTQTVQPENKNGNLLRSQPEWAEFLHLPNKKFYDFEEVKREIVQDTERVSGGNKGITKTPIRLRVYSPNVLTLTLVDLPGITRNPVGDQPANIEELVRGMCMEYVSNPNAIILAVTAANTDLANSDALNIAKQVDPAGERTVGVITKMDLMDEGTDAMDVFQGKIIPLRLGYIGTVNRSQQDINTRKSAKAARSKEKQFFLTHPAYRKIAHKMGTPYLTSTLNTLLLAHIRVCLPDLKSKLNQQLSEIDEALRGLGSSPIDMSCEASQGELMLSILTQFSNNFSNAIDGKGFDVSRLELTEIGGGAKIGYIFNKVFKEKVEMISPFENLQDEDIRAAIVYAMGPRPSLFVPELSFEILVKRQIAYLEPPGVQCANLVFEVLQELAVQSECSRLRMFPLLRDRVMEVVNNMLTRSLAPTHNMIRNLIQVEKAYINTNHPDFIGGSQAIASLMSNQDRTHNKVRPPVRIRSHAEHANGSGDAPEGNFMSFLFKNGAEVPGAIPEENTRRNAHASSTSSVRESASGTSLSSLPSSFGPPHASQKAPGYDADAGREIETDIIKELMRSYLNISKKNFVDLVPKTIMHFLVNNVKDNIQSELVREIYGQTDNFKAFLKEDEDVEVKRKSYMESRKLVAKAIDTLMHIREFSVKRSPLGERRL